MKLFRFYWDCARQGNVIGTFIAEQEEVDAAIGKMVYFGEVLGKHSEIYGELEEGDLAALTDDEDFIKQALEYGIVPTGFNPLRYLPEVEDE